MKTSTMLLITAILVVFGCLTAFNIDLKKSYLTGEYKSRFRDMKFTPLKGIDEIDIQTADLYAVSIEQGDKEGIWISKNDGFKINFTTKQNTLFLHDGGEAERSWGTVVIITKKLKTVVTQSVPKLRTVNNGYVMPDEVTSATITGYQLSHLDLRVSSAVKVFFNMMQIDTLNATIGNKQKGGAELVLSPNTKINSAQFEVPGNGKLTLMNPNITKSSYLLSDSATVTLNGKPTHLLQ